MHHLIGKISTKRSQGYTAPQHSATECFCLLQVFTYSGIVGNPGKELNGIPSNRLSPDNMRFQID
jgi:hypothetical protein